MTLPKNVYPMGAQTPKEDRLEILWEDPMYVAELKHDGARYEIRKENGTVRIVSRQEQKVDGVGTGNQVDKSANVPHLVEWFSWLPEGTIIDGEIITHLGCTSSDVTKIMGCNPDKAIERQKEQGWVKYVAYDLVFYADLNATARPWYARRNALERLLKEKIHNEGKDCPVLLSEVEMRFKKAYYEEIVNRGWEGVMLKNINGLYEASLTPDICKPKDNWYKVKRYNTYDCVVMGFTEPTMEYKGKEPESWQYWYNPTEGGYTMKENTPSDTLKAAGYTPVSKAFFMGWIGAIEFGQYKDGELIRIGQTSGIDDSIKQEISRDRKLYLGTVIEVGAMKQIKKTGALQHPRFIRFRTDKNADQCLLGEV